MIGSPRHNASGFAFGANRKTTVYDVRLGFYSQGARRLLNSSLNPIRALDFEG